MVYILSRMFREEAAYPHWETKACFGCRERETKVRGYKYWVRNEGNPECGRILDTLQLESTSGWEQVVQREMRVW